MLALAAFGGRARDVAQEQARAGQELQGTPGYDYSQSFAIINIII